MVLPVSSRNVALLLLELGPCHGYEINQRLEKLLEKRMLNGSLYPSLLELRAEGLIKATKDGRRIRYALTKAGEKELAEQRYQVARLYGFRPDQLLTLEETRKEVGIDVG